MVCVPRFIILAAILISCIKVHASQITQESSSTKPAKRVLVLSGEGSHILGVAKILSQIEKASGKKTHESYDLIVGNAMGGTLALYLAQGKSATDFIQEMTSNIRDFYATTWWRKLLTIKKFTTSKYERALKKLFGDQTLNDLAVASAVATYDHKYAEGLTIFSQDNLALPLWKTARATTASSKYKPLKLRVNGINRHIVDNAHNKVNAVLVAYTVAKEFFSKDESLEFVRLSAGNALQSDFSSNTLNNLVKEVAANDINIRLSMHADLLPTSYKDFSLHRIFLAAETTMENEKEKLYALAARDL